MRALPEKLKLCIVILSIFFTRMAGATCWNLAEHTFGIEARLLKSIAIVESNLNPSAMNRNSNGTYDIGLMQVNSIHLPRLKEIGVSEVMLKQNPCISLMTGALILKEMVDRYGYTWEAVGAYNAGIAKDRNILRHKYAEKVKKVYEQRDITRS